MVVNILRFPHQATSSAPTNQVRSKSKQELCVTKSKWKSKLLVTNCFKFLFFRVISKFLQAMFDHAKCSSFLKFLFDHFWCMQEDFIDISTHPSTQNSSSFTLHMIQLCSMLPSRRWLICTHVFFISLILCCLFLFVSLSIHVI
jgi:hypothetical protein